MNTFENARAKCPFYVSAKGQCIACECSDYSISLRFRTAGERLEYMQRYCFKIQAACPEADQCPQYMIFMKNWEAGEKLPR